jgi:cell division protein FtsB
MAETTTPTTTRRKADVRPRAERAAGRTRIVQLALFAVAAVITIDALVGEKGLLQTFRARREYAQLEASITRLRHENARLRDYSRRLKEDPAAIEDEARRKLGLVKPGEVLVIVRDADKRQP